MSQMNYVMDTNIAIDYVDIIPNGVHVTLDHPKVDLTGSNLIIPIPVVRALDKFALEEDSDRGLSAREALDRISNITEHAGLKMKEVYNLRAPISVKTSDYQVSIMPVHQNFAQSLPFNPTEDDTDGQVVLAALAVLYRLNDHPIDGTAENYEGLKFNNDNLVFLTNKKATAIIANSLGVRTSRFGYIPPAPYTGRRDLIVPGDLFARFYEDGELTLGEWKEAMPQEPDLIANEFLIMAPANDDYPADYFHDRYYHIGRYSSATKKIVRLRCFGEFPLHPKNDGQAIYAEVLADPEIACVLCTGPAGSGKTFMASVYGIDACKKSDYSGVDVVPCDVDQDKLGALPGNIDEKMDPNVQPIKNALKNYVLQSDKARLKDGDKKAKRMTKKQAIESVNKWWDMYFENIPIYHARGRDFSEELAIFDEFQDQNRKQADTLLKRLGVGGKIILTGDIGQVHSMYLDEDNNGIVYARELIKDLPMVAQVTFTEEEVIRHPFVKAITMRQREAKMGKAQT